MIADEVTLIDEDDRVIGSLDKRTAHRIPARLHRAISVFLFREVGSTIEVLLQQRSEEKIVGARLWANTVCGNVWPGESYAACADRRLEYELQITDTALEDIYTFRYSAPCNEVYEENELDHIFAGWFAGSVQPNPHEVLDTVWVSWQSVLEKKLPGRELTPWFSQMLDSSAVRAAITAYLERRNV